MADQGKWFKLWLSARRDPVVGSLSLENFARWCLFGCYLKEHGTDGMISLVAPATPLQKALEVSTYADALSVLKLLPNCAVNEEQNSAVTGVTILTVTWKNWHKYQGDMSAERMRRLRARVTAKRRGEEKRRDEKRQDKVLTSTAPDGRVKVLTDYFYEKAGKPAAFSYPQVGKFFKGILPKMSVDEVKTFIDHWFESTDPFIVKEGFRFGQFIAKFNVLKGGPIHAARTDKSSHVRLPATDPERIKVYDG